MVDAVDKSIYLCYLLIYGSSAVRRTLLLIILDLATFGTTRFYETETAWNPLPSLRPHCELKRWVCWRSAGWRLAVAFCLRELTCLRYSYRNPEDSIREFLSVPYAKVFLFFF